MIGKMTRLQWEWSALSEFGLRWERRNVTGFNLHQTASPKGLPVGRKATSQKESVQILPPEERLRRESLEVKGEWAVSEDQCVVVKNPTCPQSTCAPLFLPINRFISTIFLDSIYMHSYIVFVFLTSLCITGCRFVYFNSLKFVPFNGYYSITFQLFNSIWNNYYWNNYWNNCYSITISIIPFHFNK